MSDPFSSSIIHLGDVMHMCRYSYNIHIHMATFYMECLFPNNRFESTCHPTHSVQTYQVLLALHPGTAGERFLTSHVGEASKITRMYEYGRSIDDIYIYNYTHSIMYMYLTQISWLHVDHQLDRAKLSCHCPSLRSGKCEVAASQVQRLVVDVLFLVDLR